MKTYNYKINDQNGLYRKGTVKADRPMKAQIEVLYIAKKLGLDHIKIEICK